MGLADFWAEYGKRLVEKLSKRLQEEFGRGFAVRNLETFRAFYLEYPGLVIPHALRAELTGDAAQRILGKPCGRSGTARQGSFPGTELAKLLQIPYAVRAGSWRPGLLHPDLSWTHYRTLLRVDKADVRAFYEIESIKNIWAARELERQINSQLYERLALSRDKKGVMELAKRGQIVQRPVDILKEPVMLEFLDLPEPERLNETELERALISKLRSFLLELGQGFAFVGRQKRLTLDGDHFYPDLVFYHIKLKCYVIIELKTGKLTHGDLGQMLMYVNYYDREVAGTGDSPTIGLLLCTDKNEAVVKYVLGDKKKRIFASRYKTCLPSEERLRAELRHELGTLPLKGKGVA